MDGKKIDQFKQLLLCSAQKDYREKLVELVDGIQWKEKDCCGRLVFSSKTHKDIWKLLDDARDKSYVTEESLRNTLRLSVIIFDMFHLLDGDNDRKLWTF